MSSQTGLILLSGATGYVGGRLLPALLDGGRRVRCLVRRPEYLRGRQAGDFEIVAGDVLRGETLRPALSGVETAYYLVHSMGAGPEFEDRDRQGAANFAAAARQAGVRRIVYLGALGQRGDRLSSHLRSRQEVGEVLRRSGAEVIELRSSIVLGSGSLSFEMIRALVERLPVMVTPRWVSNLAQPIAVEDLIAYLVAAADLSSRGNRVYEIGGPEQVSYRDLMRCYARQRGLRRLMIPVPVLTPWLSSLWLGLVTPLYARVGRHLVEGLRNPTVVHDPAALAAFDVRPRGVAEAIARALANEDRELAATHWSDAVSAAGAPRDWARARFGNRLIDSRAVRVEVPPAVAFAPLRRIGGRQGWYFADWLWRLRGWMDLAFGGVGMRRGRRDPERLRAGEVVDCWRVEAFEPDRRLLLAAEMRLPGRAWLQFEVEPDGDGSIVRQTAMFDPVGLLGLCYWYAVYPLHQVVFRGMLRGIARAAERAGRPCPDGAGRYAERGGDGRPSAVAAD